MGRPTVKQRPFFSLGNGCKSPKLLQMCSKMKSTPVQVSVQLCSNYLALCLMLRSHNKSQIGLVTVVGRRIDGGWQPNIMKVIVLTKTDTFSGKC